jgi:hypothetical protein
MGDARRYQPLDGVAHSWRGAVERSNRRVLMLRGLKMVEALFISLPEIKPDLPFRDYTKGSHGHMPM